jgi:hypothetical protein
MTPVAYRCDFCQTVTCYETPPVGGPGPCRSCGGSPAFLFLLRPFQVEGFELPADAGPGVLDPNRVERHTCEPCPYFECWRSQPGKTCALGVPQHTYWDAAENRVIQPAFSGCWAKVENRRFGGDVLVTRHLLDMGVLKRPESGENAP